jgi:hypothetical protein
MDSQAWFNHEQGVHRLQWQCDFCNAHPFKALAAFQNHLREKHRDGFTESQLPLISGISKQYPDSYTTTDCLFCYGKEFEENTRKRNPGLPQDKAISLTPLQFRAHVASHMVGLALFAIAGSTSWDEEDEEDEEGDFTGSVSNVALNENHPTAVPIKRKSHTESEVLDSESPQEKWRSPIPSQEDLGPSEDIGAHTALDVPESDVVIDWKSIKPVLGTVEKMDKITQQKKWNDRARDNRGQYLSLKQVSDIIEEGIKFEIPESNDYLNHYKEQRAAGIAWEANAEELIKAENIHYPQLEALSAQAQAAALPVSTETLAIVDQILNKQREACRQSISLYERSRNEDYTKRPKYAEVCEICLRLTELNSRPSGILDLEKEQKRHEDWMRKGKKLFGKANAPLHILKTHMEYVLERNLDCFDINSDKPRVPAEPASREPSPLDGKLHSWGDPRFQEVFCICRRVEAGMMIECKLCHEWQVTNILLI